MAFKSYRISGTEELKDQGVGVVGMVIDSVGADGTEVFWIIHCSWMQLVSQRLMQQR